jgi:hypothetical protein
MIMFKETASNDRLKLFNPEPWRSHGEAMAKPVDRNEADTYVTP